MAGVINNISARPHIDVRDVKRNIENALKSNAELEARAISVVVGDGGTVILEGKVHDAAERTSVKNAAWSAEGGRCVDDQLTTAD